MTTFAPEKLLAVLEHHAVECVVIGGLAGSLHGSNQMTYDVDITPATTIENLARLAEALKELGARIRTEGTPEGLPFDRSAAFLANVTMLNLTCDCGDLDIAFTPAGTSGYTDLLASAVVVKIGDVTATVASLADIIRSKEAADRPKDRLALPVLRALLARGSTARSSSPTTP